MTSHPVKISLCPGCECVLDMAAQVDGTRQPRPNDVSVCCYCGALLVFGEDLVVNPLSEELLAKIRKEAPETYWLLMGAQSYFNEVSSRTMRMYTVYRHSRDYPEKYVVRRFDIRDDGSHTTGWVRTADSLEGIRSLIPPGLACLTRSDGDEPEIVETWL